MEITDLFRKTTEAHRQTQIYECSITTKSAIYSTTDFCENAEFKILSTPNANAEILWKKNRIHPMLDELIIGEGYLVLNKAGTRCVEAEGLPDSISTGIAVQWLSGFMGNAGAMLELYGYQPLVDGILSEMFEEIQIKGVSLIGELECYRTISKSGVEIWVDRRNFLLRKIREFGHIQTEPTLAKVKSPSSATVEDLQLGAIIGSDTIRTVEETTFRYLIE